MRKSTVGMYFGSRFDPALRLMVAACVLTVSVRDVSAQPLPIGRDGLPGGEHVASATPSPSWAATVGLGYAHTEAVPGSDSVHERAAATAALSLSPSPQWMLGATGLARLDAHRSAGKRVDDGAAFGSRLSARLRGTLRERLHAAAELGLTFPAANGAVRGFAAASPSLLGIVSYALRSPSTISLNLGARLDRSRKAIGNPGRLSADDRIAAGVSDSNAILLGLLGTTRFNETLFGAEWSWEALVGEKAPELLASPMRIELFAQHPLSRHWFVGARLGISPSTRPSAGELAPIEPRVWAAVSLGYLTPRATAAARTPTPTPTPEAAAPVPINTVTEPKAVPPEPALPPGQIRGRVRSLRGTPLRAHVEVLPLGQQLSTDEKGTFVVDVPPGRYSVVVRADGYEEQERPAEVEQNGVTILVIDLRRARP